MSPSAVCMIADPRPLPCINRPGHASSYHAWQQLSWLGWLLAGGPRQTQRQTEAGAGAIPCGCHAMWAGASSARKAASPVPARACASRRAREDSPSSAWLWAGNMMCAAEGRGRWPSCLYLPLLLPSAVWHTEAGGGMDWLCLAIIWAVIIRAAVGAGASGSSAVGERCGERERETGWAHEVAEAAEAVGCGPWACGGLRG